MNSSLSEDSRGSIITFYSYKGGTGRSMALANVACFLASRYSSKKDVLMIDWDLEAPGLHRYFPNSTPSNTIASDPADRFEQQPGLIDLFISLETSSHDKIASEEQAEALFQSLDLNAFVVSTGVPRLKLMTAGRFDKEYSTRVGTFGWESLYKKAPGLFSAFADHLSHKYEYVLIDSRTGLTDTSGICTMLMPEKLVVVFTPNRQSLEGVVDIVRRATNYRKQSADLRPLSVFPLPSRIEPAEPDLRDHWRNGDSKRKIPGYQPTFETLFQHCYQLPACALEKYFDDVQIQHVPKYAYGEEIALLTERNTDRLSMSRSYENFAERITSMAAPWQGQQKAEYDVYVSYSPKDVEEVAEVVNLIEGRGLKVWWDRDLKPGVSWEDELRKAQDNARGFIVFVGQGAVGTWQKVETERISLLARERRLPMVPVLLPGVNDLKPEMRPLAEWQWLKLERGQAKKDIDLLLQVFNKAPKKMK